MSDGGGGLPTVIARSMRRPGRGRIPGERPRRLSPGRLATPAGCTGTWRGTVPRTRPGRWLIFDGLEGEVSDVIGREPEALLRWVRPQHGRQRVARNATDEHNTPCRCRQCGGLHGSGEDVPDDGLRRPSVDEAGGAEQHGSPGS
jgi:hypothetical protein